MSFSPIGASIVKNHAPIGAIHVSIVVIGTPIVKNHASIAMIGTPIIENHASIVMIGTPISSSRGPKPPWRSVGAVLDIRTRSAGGSGVRVPAIDPGDGVRAGVRVRKCRCARRRFWYTGRREVPMRQFASRYQSFSDSIRRCGGAACLAWCVLAMAVGGLASNARAQGCEPGWAGGRFNLPGVDITVRAMATFDDGSGEALYIGGDFRVAGTASVRGLARWDGQRWSAVTSMPGEPYAGWAGRVNAMAVYDDGSGPALYVGGEISTIDGVRVGHIARWNGTAWEPLDRGVDRWVHAMAVFDDGNGPALYVGGDFRRAGELDVRGVARWDAGGWSAPPEPGRSLSVRALAVHDDGAGPALYAADHAYIGEVGSGVTGERVSRLDDGGWTILGDTRLGGFIIALHSHDDGSGPALYVGGLFQEIGGLEASGLVRWDGVAWSAVGGGVGDSMSGRVFALATHDDGSGGALYAAGSFRSAGGADINDVARWDGTAWSAVGEDDGRFLVYALASVDLGSGPKLIAGGRQGQRGDVALSGMGVWDGEGWSPPEAGAAMGVFGGVAALTVFDDGSGPQLVAGGSFERAGSMAANSVARWDGERWHAMGQALREGLGTAVFALAVFDDGQGPALYAGGGPLTGTSGPGSHIARWDGSAWAPLGEGLNGNVRAMAVYDDGDGPALYVAGEFTQAGGRLAKHIARWDGAAWSTVGVGAGEGFDRPVFALEVYDRGDGPLLIAGGNFRIAGGTMATRVARWDGERWDAMRFGLGADDVVLTLESYSLGGREMLFAGGDFLNIDGEPMSRVARWDGVSWHPVGVGLQRDVNALVGFDDGTGPALYAAGHFRQLGDDRESLHIARWDGSDWSALGTGLDYEAEALAVHDDGSGPALFAGGVFTTAGGAASIGIARWNGCDACPADLDGDGALTIFDFLVFQNLFDRSDPRADFDGDGELTVLDFLVFQTAFDSGCS